MDIRAARTAAFKRSCVPTSSVSHSSIPLPARAKARAALSIDDIFIRAIRPLGRPLTTVSPPLLWRCVTIIRPEPSSCHSILEERWAVTSRTVVSEWTPPPCRKGWRSRPLASVQCGPSAAQRRPLVHLARTTGLTLIWQPNGARCHSPVSLPGCQTLLKVHLICMQPRVRSMVVE